MISRTFFPTIPAVVALALGLACGSSARLAFGHGNPIHVNVAAGALTASGDIVESRGYAKLVYADPSEDAAFFQLGDVLTTNIPGFDILGMVPGEQISLEALSRPDFSTPGSPQRWLWYWDPQTQEVADAPTNPTLELASTRGFLPSPVLTQSTASAATSVKLADLQNSDIGVHRHLLTYLLDNSPEAPFGVYAFFARMTSPQYGASEPMLIALNHGLDATTFAQGGIAINAAARLPGDFDGDDNVDGADFVLWQRTLGSTTSLAADATLDGVVNGDDLAIWREGFGDVGPSELRAAAGVPEPAGSTIAILLALGVLNLTFRSPPLDGES